MAGGSYQRQTQSWLEALTPVGGIVITNAQPFSLNPVARELVSGQYSCSRARSPGNVPTEKGAGRRDTRGRAAPRHRFCTSTTDSNQLQKQGSCRRKSSGQQGTGSRLLLGAVCQPGTGAPGLCWRPLGDSRDAARCPTVSWVCQGRSPPPLSPCAARSSPDPWQHQARAPANAPTLRAPAPLAEAPHRLQQTPWPPALQGAPGMGQAAARLQQLQQSLHPTVTATAPPGTPRGGDGLWDRQGSTHLCSQGAVKHPQRKSWERRRQARDGEQCPVLPKALGRPLKADGT